MTPAEALVELRKLADAYQRQEISTTEWSDRADQILREVVDE